MSALCNLYSARVVGVELVIKHKDILMGGW